MIQQFNEYRRFRRLGFARKAAFRLAGGTFSPLAIAAYTLDALIVLALIAVGYLAVGYFEQKEENSLRQQSEYIQTLQYALSKCLDKQDSPIWIGDELHLCAAKPTGVTK